MVDLKRALSGIGGHASLQAAGNTFSFTSEVYLLNFRGLLICTTSACWPVGNSCGGTAVQTDSRRLVIAMLAS